MEASGHLWGISGTSGRQLGGRRRLGGIWEAEMLVLLCVFEGHSSKSMCFTGVVSEFLTTVWCIIFEMLTLPCVFEGHSSKSMCFTGVVSEFLTTVWCIIFEMLTLPCVFDGHCSKTL